MRLVLIRHAAVAMEPDLPANQWSLSEAGLQAARALSSSPPLQTVARFLSSPEPKAMATANAIADGRPTAAIAAFAELDRSAAGWLRTQAEYTALVAEILQHPQRSVRGCEPAAKALARFKQAVTECQGRFPGEDLAVVSHGLVLSLFMADIRRLSAPDLATWERIRLPDLAVVDPLEHTVLVDFGSNPG